MEFYKKTEAQIKPEPVFFCKNTIDLTGDDDNIEPEVERIADSISVNINSALKYTLQPFVMQYNNKRNQHNVISGVLQQLPEFQKLVTENAELKMAINNLKKELHAREEITLEVREKQVNKGDGSVVSKIYQDIAEVNKSVTENTRLVNEFYKEVQSHDILEESEEEAEESDDEKADESDDEKADESDDEQADESDDEQSDKSDDEQADESDDEQSDKSDDEQKEESDNEEKEESDDEQKEESDNEEKEESDNEEKEESDNEQKEEEELYIVEMELDGKDVQYYTNDDENGMIYNILEGDDVGKQIGIFEDGEPVFS